MEFITMAYSRSLKL